MGLRLEFGLGIGLGTVVSVSPLDKVCETDSDDILTLTLTHPMHARDWPSCELPEWQSTLTLTLTLSLALILTLTRTRTAMESVKMDLCVCTEAVKLHLRWR